MKAKIFTLLLAVCLLASLLTVKVAAVSARDGEVGDEGGVVTDATGTAGATPTVTMPTASLTAPASTAPATAPVTTAPVTSAPVTTGALSEDAEEGGGLLAIILAAVAAVAIVTLVVILVPRMRKR